MLRGLVLAGFLLVPMPAAAESSWNGPRLAFAPTVALYQEKTTTDGLGAGIGSGVSSVDYVSGQSVGGLLEVAGSWRRGSLDLGFVIRGARLLAMEMEVGEQTLSMLNVGPQLTMRADRLYVRTELVIGALFVGDDGYTQASLAAGTGAEVGYAYPLGAKITGQIGVGALATVARSSSPGDWNNYGSRHALLTAVLSLSFVFQP